MEMGVEVLLAEISQKAVKKKLEMVPPIVETYDMDPSYKVIRISLKSVFVSLRCGCSYSPFQHYPQIDLYAACSSRIPSFAFQRSAQDYKNSKMC